MADTHVISALENKRAELSGDLKKLDNQRKAVIDRIRNVDQTLKLFGYQKNPNEITPRCRYARLFKRGELRRMVADILRTANAPLKNRQIAVQIIQKRGWDGEDAELLERVTGSVKPARRSVDRARLN